MAPVSLPAEDPLFLMYTSGTARRPKDCQHSIGGYLSYVTGTSRYVLDIQPEDRYFRILGRIDDVIKSLPASLYKREEYQPASFVVKGRGGYSPFRKGG